jgi:hypothetical protein
MVSITDFTSNRVTNPGQSEIVRQRLYDYQLYPAAGTQQLSFFQQPIGQGITTALGATVGSAKTQWDTSQELGGQLPSGKSFLVESIEVLYLPGASAAANTYTTANLSQFAAVAALALTAAMQDVQQFYSSGMLEFNILSKNYLRETPLLAFPPKAHLDLSAATATNSATTAMVAQGLAKAAGRPYYIEPRVTLQPAVNFEVLLRWPALVPTISTFNARVGVILDGYQLRASQ